MWVNFFRFCHIYILDKKAKQNQRVTFVPSRERREPLEWKTLPLPLTGESKGVCTEAFIPLFRDSAIQANKQLPHRPQRDKTGPSPLNKMGCGGFIMCEIGWGGDD